MIVSNLVPALAELWLVVTLLKVVRPTGADPQDLALLVGLLLFVSMRLAASGLGRLAEGGAHV